MAVKSGYGPGFCADVVSGVTLPQHGEVAGAVPAAIARRGIMGPSHGNNCNTTPSLRTPTSSSSSATNDQPGGKPGRSTDLATEFPVNISHYVDDVESHGCKKAIPVTPLTRRSFRDGTTEKRPGCVGRCHP